MSIGRNHVSLNQGAHKIPGAVEALNKLAAGHGTQGKHPAASPIESTHQRPAATPSDDDARESDRELVW